ncbi:MAG: hydrogenase maturation protease [Asgard group archaeon]|nr:hydrogenase maturation protease [Asgard group archaeon]
MKIKGIKRLKKIDITKKICIMGIGAFDRADDYAGLAAIEKLEKVDFPDNIKIINAGPVPEAFTGVVKKENPDLLIIIDAAQMDEEPGTIRVFTEKDIDTAYMITPHKVSMTMYLKYLRFELDKLQGLFIGIQPKSLSYMEPMDPAVVDSVNYLSEFLVDLLRK